MRTKTTIKYKSYEESRYYKLPEDLIKKMTFKDKKNIENLIDKVYIEGFEDGQNERELENE